MSQIDPEDAVWEWEETFVGHYKVSKAANPVTIN